MQARLLKLINSYTQALCVAAALLSPALSLVSLRTLADQGPKTKKKKTSVADVDLEHIEMPIPSSSHVTPPPSATCGTSRTDDPLGAFGKRTALRLAEP